MTGRPAGRGQVPGPLLVVGVLMEVVGLRMPAFGRALKDAASFLLLFFSVTRARKLRRVFVLAVGDRGLKYHVKSMLGSGGNFLAHRRDELPSADEMLAGGIIGHGASFNASPSRSKVRVVVRGKSTMQRKVASWMHACASAMRDRIDQPEARQAQKADKDQGNGVYDHAMPVIILALRAFIFREVGNR